MTASKHGWHLFDADKGLECRQATGRLRANRWEIRKSNGLIVELNDEEFEQLRCPGPNPKGL